MTTRRDWTTEENQALCLAYCIMLQAQQRGDKFNKSAIRRELRGTDAQPGPLYNRSNGSIEAKFMNASAAAASVGIPIVNGYKPAPNYQRSLRPILSVCWHLVQQDTDHGIKTDLSIAIA